MAVSGMQRVALAAVVVLGLVSVADKAVAQTPFTGVFTFSGTSGVTNPFPYTGTPILNLTVGDLTRNNLTASSSSGNFRASGFALDPVVGSLSGTVDLSKYFEFTLTASPGFTFNLQTLNFGVGRSATGPRSFLWRSSADSYAASIPSYSSLGSSGFFSNTSGTLTMSDTTATTGTNVVLALSGSSSSYQGLSTISLRFYGYNSEAAGGTGGFQGPLTFTGALLGSAGTAYTWSGGAGNWENGQNGNFGQAYANSSTATATFNGSGDAVTVSGTVEAATMTVDSPGYSFQGGTISLANATVAVNADSTSIASVLAGSAGLVKTGTGSLSLTGSNTYVGLTNLSSGRLVIASDSALGAASNDLAIASTLVTTTNVSLGSGRDLSGAGTLDIAPGTTLTSSGSFGMSSVTLSNSGTLDLQGATRSVGTLTFGTAAVVNGAGAISATGLTATSVTTGSAIVNPAITFTTGDKTVDVGTGGTLVLNGDIAGTTGRIAKTGLGTLIASGSNSTSGFRLGAAGASPANGGTLILAAAAASGTGQLQANYGTLQATGSFTFANGLSIGGRSGAVAVLGGTNAMTFSGSTSFFRATATSGELRFDVNNATSLNGVIGPTSGGGTATGITIGGTGSLAINGNASALVDAITLQDAVDLMVNDTLGGSVNVGAVTLLGGTGTISGPVQVADSGYLAPGLGFSPGTLTINNVLTGTSLSIFAFDLSATDQTVGGGVNDLVTGVTNLTLDGALFVNGIGDFSTVAEGTKWRLFNYSGTLTDLSLGIGEVPTLAAGRSFVIDTATPGQVNVMVVPEPSAFVLASLGVALAAATRLRRRRS